MQYPLFKQFINASSSLTRQQKNTLHRLLFEDCEHDRSHELEQSIEGCFAEQPHCPHCQSLEVGRWGIRNGRAVNIVRRLSMLSVAHRLLDSDTLKNGLIIWIA